MERNLGVYRSTHEAVLDWSQRWGLALAYAITQSVDTAEQVVAESIVGVIASPETQAVDDGPKTVDVTGLMLRFAGTVYYLGERRAFRGFAHDDFFKLPITVRAAVFLKVRGKFSRRQIAVAMNVDVAEVDALLERARLAFTKGKPWLLAGPRKRQLDDAKLISPCPDLRDGTLFAYYLENDLGAEDTMKLHKHFVACVGCRANLLHFKNLYSDWVFTLPEVEITKATSSYLRKTVHQARRARPDVRQSTLGPGPVPGLKKLIADRQTQILLVSFAVFLFLMHVFRN